MSKSILQIIQSCSVQKTRPKETRYSRNETILEIGHHAKAIAHAKCLQWVKTLNSKKYVKIHSTNHLQLLCAKKHLKETRYSRNETILEIGHHAKAIAHAKCLQWVKIKIPKNMSKSILQIIKSCSVQKTTQKRLDIREMRPF